MAKIIKTSFLIVTQASISSMDFASWPSAGNACYWQASITSSLISSAPGSGSRSASCINQHTEFLSPDQH
jgi:hypothetical protein